MKILYLSFYFEPDLCAGSFRNSPLAHEMASQLPEGSEIHVITTVPNRYSTYTLEAPQYEEVGKIRINRVQIPVHKSGFLDQINSFKTYFFQALKLSKGREYDLVFASSSRLFTAFLGKRLSLKYKAPLYLDIRDIFTDTLKDVIKNPLVRVVILPVLNLIERFTFSKANTINLVSEGFRSYFQRYPKPEYDYHTNGIDKIFLEADLSPLHMSEDKVVAYAGNIGEGQGLEKIIPEAAERLPDYTFKIIGDGGTKPMLEQKVKEMGLKNVQLLNPISRNELIQEYRKSHFLFLHLNDYEAFHKVLPSKIFEYGAFHTPVIAGVGGYAAKFISAHLDNHILFAPGDVESMVSQLQAYDYQTFERVDFKEQHSRSNIMKSMASKILATAK